MTIKQMIKHLNKQDQAYILANDNLAKDILQQKLDHEEIATLLMTAHFVDAQKKETANYYEVIKFHTWSHKITSKTGGNSLSDINLIYTPQIYYGAIIHITIT